MRAPPPLTLGATDAEALRGQISSDATGTSAAARRAYIVLLSADGCGPSTVADLLGCSR